MGVSAMIRKYFLGANTGGGFYSLYGDFCAGADDFLTVIKGGPGGGKSGVLRRIGAGAEKAGLDVEYILCSGDPASLDGVYVPALRRGWVDGTAPHTLDPACFGATGAYLDLGAYCRADATYKMRGELLDLTERYRALYDEAYAYLRAAAAIDPRLKAPGAAERSLAVRRALSAAETQLPRAARGGARGSMTRRFLGGVTCAGEALLTDTLASLCGRLYIIDDRLGAAAVYLDTLAEEALRRGVDATVCLYPHAPVRAQAVLLPGLSLGFLACGRGEGGGLEEYRHVRLDAASPPERREGLRADEKLCASLRRSGAERLARAKALHDELEALYNPYVDFDAVRTAGERELTAALRK